MYICVYACESSFRVCGGAHRVRSPWSWSDRQFWAVWYECLDLNLGPLEEQQVVLNIKPALQAMQKRIFSCLPS